MLENHWIAITCPKCQYTEYVRMISMKLQETVICHNCKANIKLIDQTASIYLAFQEVNNTLNSFKDIFKRS